MVALAVGGMAVAICGSTMAHASTAVRRLTAQASATRVPADRTIRLAQLVSWVRPALDTTPTFAGSEVEATFASTCLQVAGWPTGCRLSLHRIGHAPRQRLVVAGSGMVDSVLVDEVVRIRLLYLASAADGGTWAQEWAPAVRPPLAIGVERVTSTGVDTILLRVGAP
ncbi:MAG: hypothetical protein MUE41_15030 [Gemmatimonadaceae bacterium]|nr:hypothetical protein [Gemmatimonadaceae bacterium]